MQVELEPIKKEIATISTQIASLPAINMDVNSYPRFSTLKDGASGEERANQFRAYCQNTAYGGYPAGAYEWNGTQTPDGAGRILNVCLDGGKGGSCQTRGWCTISPAYLNGLRSSNQSKIDSLNASLAAKSSQLMNNTMVWEARKQPDVSMPACCQALYASGANLDVPVINQSCQTSQTVGTMPPSSSGSSLVASSGPSSSGNGMIILIAFIFILVVGITTILVIYSGSSDVTGSYDFWAEN